MKEKGKIESQIEDLEDVSKKKRVWEEATTRIKAVRCLDVLSKSSEIILLGEK